MPGRWSVLIGLIAASGCASKLQGGKPATDGSSHDGGHPLSCPDTVEHGCQSSTCALDWTTAIANVNCANGMYYSAECGGYDVLRFVSTNVSQVDSYQTNAYYSQPLGLLVASTLQSTGPNVECGLGPAGGFVVPDCEGSAFVSLCPTDAGTDVRQADAGTFPPPFTDAGCSGEPRLLTLYCETPDQLLGTDAGRGVTSPAEPARPRVSWRLRRPAPLARAVVARRRTVVRGLKRFSVYLSIQRLDAAAMENRCCYLAQVVCGV